MSNKVLTVLVVVALLMGAVGIMFPRSTQTTIENIKERVLGSGAQSTTDSCETIAGITQCTYTANMVSPGSTTPISGLPGWKTAGTSTLDFSSCTINTATGTALTLGLYTGATPGATTTTIWEVSLAAGAKTTISSATSTTIAPSTYLTIGDKGGMLNSTANRCIVRYSDMTNISR